MQLTEKDRAALVEELAEAMNTANNTLFANGGHDDITEDDEGAATLLRRLAPACLPIIDRLLADRAVPEPDAEAAATAIHNIRRMLSPHSYEEWDKETAKYRNQTLREAAAALNAGRLKGK